MLEVGSGQAPNPRANVLCDLYVGDDTERNRNPLILDRPFVVGDVHELPFRDGSFDYVICSHVLEHVEDPERAASELARVAPRGYVEVPSSLNERMLPFPFHRWVIDADDKGRLVFRGKANREPDPELAAWFRRLDAECQGWTEFFLDHLEALGNIHALRWEGWPRVRVEGGPGEAEGSAFDADFQSVRETLVSGVAVPRSRERTLGVVWSFFRRRSDPRVKLASRLACPVCRRGLSTSEKGPHELVCGRCDRGFPVVDTGRYSVPVLLRR